MQRSGKCCRSNDAGAARTPLLAFRPSKTAPIRTPIRRKISPCVMWIAWATFPTTPASLADLYKASIVTRCLEERPE